MATKNFLFTSKFRLLAAGLLSLVLSACSGVKTRTDRAPVEPPRPAPVERISEVPEALRPSEVSAPSEPPHETPAGQTFTNPKIGLILGPGSARAYAHAGVVQEFAKARLPITHVVGLESGALVGAIFASKGQPFDVEWQMFKLKDFKAIPTFLKTVFQSQKAEDFKISFACPAYNLVKQQHFMMNKGTVTQMLPYCLSMPPMLKPYGQNIAGATELATAAEYLKSKGANFIVYVNVLAAKDGVMTESLEDSENLIWSVISQSLSSQWQSVDYVVSVPVQDYGLTDLAHRREVLQKGMAAGQAAASQIARKLGL